MASILPYNDTVLDPGRSLMQGLLSGQQYRQNALNANLLNQQAQIETDQYNRNVAQQEQEKDMQMLAMIAQGLEGVPPQDQQGVYISLLDSAKKMGFDVSDAPQQLDKNTLAQLNMVRRHVFQNGNGKTAEMMNREQLMSMLPIDESGQIKPEEEWTAQNRFAMIQSRMAPGMQGSADITTAVTPGLKDKVTGTKEDIARHTAMGKGEGGDAADLLADATEWESNREFINTTVLPEIGELLQASPGSSFSSVVQSGLGKAFGNLSATDAQTRVSQIGEILTQSVPFSPGSQSDAEMKRRQLVLATVLENPSVGIPAKVKAIETFLVWQDSRANHYRKRAGEIMGRDYKTEQKPAENSKPEPQKIVNWSDLP